MNINKKVPPYMHPLMRDLADLNGRIAQWHMSSYKKPIPTEIALSVARLADSADLFLNKHDAG